MIRLFTATVYKWHLKLINKNKKTVQTIVRFQYNRFERYFYFFLLISIIKYRLGITSSFFT